MGRTVMPFSFVLEEERGRWGAFRRALPKEDQKAFDCLFDQAKFHTPDAVYTSHPWPMETILLSICLEHEEMLGEILGEVRRNASLPTERVVLTACVKTDRRALLCTLRVTIFGRGCRLPSVTAVRIFPSFLEFWPGGRDGFCLGYSRSLKMGLMSLKGTLRVRFIIPRNPNPTSAGSRGIILGSYRSPSTFTGMETRVPPRI